MEQNFQNRLNNFQLPPPDGVWSKIDNVLEAQQEKRLARKLFHFEIIPPNQVWQKLSFIIGNDKKSDPSKKPVKKFLVYASIAAALILSIVSVNMLTGSDNTQSDESLIAAPKSSRPSMIQSSPKQNIIDLTDPSSHTIAVIHPPAKKTWLIPHKLTLKNIEERLIGTVSSLEKFVPESASRNQEISYEDGLDKYMIYASDDGNAVRLPKKMYDNFACPTNDPSCREKIKILQQKMVQGTFASDFTGVLDLLSNMDDRK